MVTYPEHEKLDKVVQQWRALDEFMEWLKGSTRVQQPRLFLAHYVDGDAYPVPSRTPTDDLLAEYFGIDRVELEREKRAMLEHQRALNETTSEDPADSPLTRLIKATREVEPFTEWRPGVCTTHVNPAPGELTIISAHGKWRPAIVMSVGPRRARVAYLTPNRLNNADRHYSAEPLITHRPLHQLASFAPVLEDLARLRGPERNAE